MFIKTTCLGFGSAALLTAAVVFAQNEPTSPQTQPRQPQGRDAPRQQAGASSLDSLLVAWLVADNETEIALAHIAEQRSTNPEVKQFASRMVEDHKAMVAKLRELGSSSAAGSSAKSGAATSAPGSSPQGAQRPKDDAASGQSSTRRNEAGTAADREGELFEIANLKRELAEQCLATAKRELEAKSGPEFDRCYMTAQVLAHLHANDVLTVFRKRGSQELGKALAEGQSTVQRHLEHAKRLAKTLEGGSKPATAAN